MLDEDGGDRLTAHTTYPVPFILVSNRYDQLAANNGSMADVAPTILKLLEIEQPKLMTGKSLI
jgi:2,3-bisphosphoglycerate-independent phosphoglycerate mutase